MNFIFQKLRFPAILLLGILNVSFTCSQPKTLTILYTNDMHASFVPHEAGWVRTDPKPMVGGFQELGYIADSIRKASGGAILLDAGDVMTGTPIAEIEYKGAVGGALFEMMNMIGYDAWTIGNHDLDISQENLRKLTHLASFPAISANLTDSAGNFPFNNKEYLIINKNGLRIGIIGLMSEDLFRLTNTNNLRGLKVMPVAETAQKIIDRIQGETDLLIALTHEGSDEDSLLATRIHGLSAIIGGHSHTRLKSPRTVNGVIICQAGSNCENLGELELTFENDSVKSYSGKLITLWANAVRPENDLSKFIRQYKLEIDKEFQVVLGTLSQDWKRSRNGESNIGNFIADAIREAAGADLGLTNSSGIRKDLRAGNITKLDLFEIAPFRNYLCTFSVSGKELRSLVARYLRSLIDGRSSIDLAGVRCSWKRAGGEPKIDSLSIGGKEVADESSYVMATTDFVLSQGDKYVGLVPEKVDYSKTTILKALIGKVQKEKNVNASLNKRFEEKLP